MIKISKLPNNKPYNKFKELFNKALCKNQDPIDAIVISSYNSQLKKVCSRYVNLKYINKSQWIFFSNYDSNKANHFKTHEQISCLIYWHSINVQIRIDATIKKCSSEISDEHFVNRSDQKNALAISSKQSREIDSYNEILENYENTLKNNDLSSRPKYWGGYCFEPTEFEFWTGHESRINKRELYSKTDNKWVSKILEP